MSAEMPWQAGDIVQINNTGNYNGYYRILQINTGNEFVIDFNYESISSPGSARVISKAFLIHGYDELPSGFSVELTRQYMIVSINNLDYFFLHGITFDNNKWYSTVINLSNLFRSLSVYIYELDKPLNNINPQLETSALKLLYNNLIFINDKVSVDSGGYWSLVSGPIRLTNIRIFKRIIEEEAHNIVLNQYVVNDTQLAELVDNAIPELRLLRIPNPR